MSFDTTLLQLVQTSNKVQDAYWILHYQLRRYDSLIVIPLVITSSLTSISAVTQLIGPSLALQISTIILSVFVTILAGLQKYLEFDRRSAVAKQVAKRWGSVSGKVDFFRINLDTLPDRMARTVILNSIYNEIDAIGGALEDIPSTEKSRQYTVELRTNMNTASRALAV